MSDAPDKPENHQADGRRPRAITVLAAILTVEAVAIAVTTFYLGVEIFTSPAASIPSAVALTVVAAIAAVWVAVIALNVLRGNAWVRAAAVVIQVLLIALAVGSFQGEGAEPGVGVALLIPAVLVLVLVFTKSVVAYTSRRA